MCESCDKNWSSAHSYKLHTQQCKACTCEAYPTHMWENDGKGNSDEERKVPEKPYLSHLCRYAGRSRLANSPMGTAAMRRLL